MNLFQQVAQAFLPRFETPSDRQTYPALKTLVAATERPLRWNRRHRFGREFELRSGEASVGTLSFHGPFSSIATAAAADGTWTLRRTGFWRTGIEVRVAGSDVAVAIFRSNPWRSGGWLEFHDGRRFRAMGNCWATRFELRSSCGEVLTSLRAGPWSNRTAEVELAAAAEQLPARSLLLLFGWYLAIITRNDAAAAGAATGDAS